MEELKGINGTNILGRTAQTPKKIVGYRPFSFTEKSSSIALINGGNGLLEVKSDWNPLINPRIGIFSVNITYDMKTVSPSPFPRVVRRRRYTNQNFFNNYLFPEVSNGLSTFSSTPKDIITVSGSVRFFGVDEQGNGESGVFVGEKTLTVSGFYQVE